MHICQLVSRHRWQTKLCRTRFDVIDACAGSDVTVSRTGPGWDGWDSRRPAVENLKAGLGYIPDVISVYKPQEIPGIGEVPALRVMHMNEVHEDRFSKEVGIANPNLIIFHHSCEIDRFGGRHCRERGIRYEYIPHVYNPEFFYDRGGARDIDFLLIGALSDQIYPLRAKFKAIMPELTARGYKCHVHKHPGYRCEDAWTNRYQRELGEIISRAKVTMFCSSIYKYRLQKYSEVPACLSLPMADEPIDVMPYVGAAIDEDTNIIKECEYYIRDADLHELTACSYRAYALLTVSYYADCFLTVLKGLL